MKPMRIGIALVLGLALAFLIMRVAMAQDPVPHGKTVGDISYEDCVDCHGTGKDDATLMPDDHAQRKNVSCRGCHKEVLLPPDISHRIAGWENCLDCHERWLSEAVDIPNLAAAEYDHAVRKEDTCTRCHTVAAQTYEGMPQIACGVCHPQSAALETIHNGPDNWVDCLDCHPTSDIYPHDPGRVRLRNEDCMACHNEPNSLTLHIARGDLHPGVECAACHMQVATVERDPVDGRIRVAHPETAEGVPPDDPGRGMIVKEVDCQRCHVADNRVAAPVAELPPRSVLCLLCHDASPIIQDPLSWAGTIIFGLGMVVVASIWVQGSVAGQRGLSFSSHLRHFAVAFVRLVTTPRVFVFVWSFIIDGMVHRRLFQRSKLRWVAHACMLFGIMARMALGVLTWLVARLAPAASFTQVLVDKNSPLGAFTYDALGLAVIVGGVLAVVRRYVIKDEQLITGHQDAIAIALIGAIFVMGFVAEGARILVTNLPPGLAAYSFVSYLTFLVLRLIPVNWGVAYGWLWYIHVGLVAALAAYLPFSKFFHILVSPVITALNAARKVG